MNSVYAETRRMKRIVRSLLGQMGYVIRRKRNSPAPRSSMARSLQWLGDQDFQVSTVLDVGASDGRWSELCMSVYPDAHYVLFEPQPVHQAALRAFALIHEPAVSVVSKAVGGSVGRTLFNVSDPFGGSLAQVESENTVEVELTTIDCTLSDIAMKGPFLLKMDTHGFERPILDGAVDTLLDCEVLIIEAYNYRIEPEAFLFWELCAHLSERGFRPIDLVDTLHRVHDGAFWQMDLCFVSSSWPGFSYLSYR